MSFIFFHSLFPKQKQHTTSVTVAQLPLNSKKAHYVTSIHAF